MHKSILFFFLIFCSSYVIGQDYKSDVETTAGVCAANFSYQIDSLTVTFANESQGESTDYFWSFGDGYYAYTENPIHNYEDEGYYEVWLTIYDSVSNCLGDYYENIFVSDLADTIIKDDSITLAILVLDFLSYNFEQANISYYQLCESCDSDSLPFEINFEEPGDFGGIVFNYTENQDTFFAGTIVWMGTGEIYYPEHFTMADEFIYLNVPVPKPPTIQYFDFWLTPYYFSWEEFKIRADSAWLAIESLELTHIFTQNDFRVGIYAYANSVGAFDPGLAKWIIFLYKGNDFDNSIKYKRQSNNILIFPNPASNEITIKGLSKSANFKLFDIQGRNVLTKHIEKETTKIQISELNEGIYFYQIMKSNTVLKRGKIVIQN